MGREITAFWVDLERKREKQNMKKHKEEEEAKSIILEVEKERKKVRKKEGRIFYLCFVRRIASGISRSAVDDDNTVASVASATGSLNSNSRKILFSPHTSPTEPTYLPSYVRARDRVWAWECGMREWERESACYWKGSLRGLPGSPRQQSV